MILTQGPCTLLCHSVAVRAVEEQRQHWRRCEHGCCCALAPAGQIGADPGSFQHSFPCQVAARPASGRGKLHGASGFMNVEGIA